MSIRYYANAPATTLAAPVSSSGTLIQVASVAGLPIQYPFTLILDRGETTEEAVSVTAASGTSLTITRAIDGTTAFGHALGGTVEHGVTAQDVREPNEHINATNSVHGVTGNLVGTTDTQTLTNKNLSSASNTFPASLALDSEVTAVQTDLNNHKNTGGPHVPIGGIIMWGASSTPSNYIQCKGQAVSRTTYSALFAVIGTNFGAGDGSTTFNLPNITDRFPMGSGGSASVGDTGGSSTKTISTANLPSHSHSMGHTHAIDHNHPSTTTSSAGTHNHSATYSVTDGAGSTAYRTAQASTGVTAQNLLQSDGAHTHSVNLPAYTGTSGASSAANTGSTGSGTSFDITNPYLALNFLIRAL